MKKTLLVYCLLVLCSVANPSLAQKVPVKVPQNREIKLLPVSRELQVVSEGLQTKYRQNQTRALQMARKNGWVLTQTTPQGGTLSLQGIDERGMPLYHVTYDNVRAAATTGTDKVWVGGEAGLHLSGSLPALAGKFGIWDGGRVRGSHQELTGRVIQRDGAVANDNHATHVAGTLIASGANAQAKGMAHGARDLQAWDFNFDIPEIAEAAGQLLVSNHSYGSTTGWRYNSSRTPSWEWWGDISASATEDIKFGQYNFQARDLDQIAFYAPYYLMVKAAGNNRNENGPAVGEPYWRINADRTAWEMVAARPEGISANDSFESIPTYGNAKNLLMVGAVEPIEAGYTQPADVRMTPFSSWGPTDDGRIKPDLVGNGAWVYSSTAGGDGSYAYYSGTSMASPNVAGSLFLLQEHFANLNNGAFMRAATLKGVAIHTADESGPAPGPDYVHGWGLLNTRKAADVISNTGGRHLLQERTLAQGEVYTIQVKAAGAGPLTVTISWTDPESAISTTLNDRSPRLVNDLDVRVTQGLSTFQPWILNPASPTAPATFGDNIRDNVEHIYLANPVAGQTYTISVRHKGVLQRGPQAFSLLVSGVSATQYCLSQPSSDADSHLAKVVMGSITKTFAGCGTYRDLTNLTAQVEPGQQIPFSLTLGTCGADQLKMARIFVDWNNDGDFTDAGETVATSGVVPGTADFKGFFTVPVGTAVPGDRPRVRIVLQETAQANLLQPCGTYGKGETQDYLLQIMVPASDVGVTSVLLPQDGVCGSPNQAVTLTLKNFGANLQTNFPVTAEVREGSTLIATLQGTFTGSLEPNREASLDLPGTFSTTGGKTYTIVAQSSLPADNNETNNSHTAAFTTSSPSPSPTATAVACGEEPVLLKATSVGTVFWYDALSGGTLIGTGPAVTTAQRPANGTYYAAANDFSGTIGPKTKNDFKGGSYNQYTTDVHFTTQVPLLLDKVRLYIGNGGRIVFRVLNTKGQEVSSSSLEVSATRSESGTGAQTNDPNDTGTLYKLDMEIPEAGDYVLKISYQNGATIFRNNSGVSGYPFTLPGVMAITGNSTSPLFYYYLYDLQVRALGCPSARVPVPIQSNGPPATVTLTGPATFCAGDGVTLQATEVASCLYQWYQDGDAIAGASASSFRATASGDYHVTVKNPAGPAACGESSSAPVTVTVTPSPVGGETKASVSAVCGGTNAGTIFLTGQTGTVLRWESSADLATWAPLSNTSTSLDFSNLTATTHFRAVVHSGSCHVLTSVSTVQVSAVAQATVNARSATTFCQGGFVTLSASAGTGYLWSGGQTTRTINVTASGSHTVQVTYENGCSSTSAPVVVTVNPLPVATITTSGPTTFCDGGSVTLTASEGTSYRWSDGQTTRTITVSEKGSYNVTVADEKGCSTASSPVSVTVLPVPEASITASGPTTFCGGGSVVLTASEAVGFRWSTGETTRAITAKTGGSYTVAVTNEAGCQVNSAPIQVTVHALPGTTLTANGPTTFCVGGSVTLTAAEGANYQWSDGRTSRSIQVRASGKYTVTVTSDQGCATTSEQVTVTVNPAPLAAITASGPTTFCAGGSVELAATAVEGAAYRWSDGQTTRAITVRTSGNYTVTVTSAAGCTATSDPAPVTVRPGPVARAGEDAAICQGGSTALTASGGTRFSWSPALGLSATDVANPVASPQVTTTYTVTVTNEEGCASTDQVTVLVMPTPPAVISARGATTFCQGDFVTLAASEGSGYLWSNGQTTRTINVTASGTYTVIVTNEKGCSRTAAPVTVTVSPLPTATITTGGNTSFCQGESVTLTASEGASYRWSDGQTTRTITVGASGSFAVTVTNGQGCAKVSDPVAVMVQPEIANNSVAGTQAVCPGAEPVALRGSLPTGGDAVFAFAWESSTAGPTNGFFPAVGFNKGQHYAPPAIQQATWFRRRVFSGSCSHVSEAIMVSVKIPPSASIEQNNANSICEGNTTTLTANGGNRYLWSNGALTQSITVNSSGTYTATVINDQDCFAVTQAVSVTVMSLPNSPEIIQKGNLLVSSFPTGNQWYLDGKAIAGATEQSHEAFLSGAYTVVVNQNGCLSAPSTAVQYQAQINEQTLQLLVFPNPSSGTFSADFQVQGMENGQLRLVNMLGQEVYRQELTGLTGKQAVQVAAEQLAHGIYVLQLRIKDQVFTRRIQIKR